MRTRAVPGSPAVRIAAASAARGQGSAGFVRRIADQAMTGGGSAIRITLSPAHLGELRIDLSVAGDVVRGRVRAGSAAARDLILAHLEDLRRELEERGLRMGRFLVEAGEAEVDPKGRPRSHRRQVLDVTG
ncbi:MAG TPA: flagellar hook-length control protein FliK [Planctomycetota bacterium]|nr:flagellar hook-length control protein FliK [Planctomycetota bacterium]